MNDRELVAKVRSSMYRQCQERGYAATVDVMMDLGILQKEQYENWRRGRVPYLEKVCTVNLSKLYTLRHEMSSYAQKANLKPSYCFYKQWAVKKRIPLRFSKSGREDIERQYATHFVDSARVGKLKSSEKPMDREQEI